MPYPLPFCTTEISYVAAVFTGPLRRAVSGVVASVQHTRDDSREATSGHSLQKHVCFYECTFAMTSAPPRGAEHRRFCVPEPERTFKLQVAK